MPDPVTPVVESLQEEGEVSRILVIVFFVAVVLLTCVVVLVYCFLCKRQKGKLHVCPLGGIGSYNFFATPIFRRRNYTGYTQVPQVVVAKTPSSKEMTHKYTIPHARVHFESATPGGSPSGVRKLDITPDSTDDCLSDDHGNNENQSSAIMGESDRAARDHGCGQLKLSLIYDCETQTLTIKLNCALGLRSGISKTLAAPYAKLTILPDKRHSLQTKTKHKTLSPYWNETFIFDGFPREKLNTKVLRVDVIDRTGLVGDRCVGYCKIPFNLLFSTSESIVEKDISTYLRPYYPKPKFGELMVSLSHSPSTSRVTVGVLKARGLKASSINGACDPYVVMSLYYDYTKIEKQTSTGKLFTVNPVWNEVFSFPVSEENLRRASVHIKIKTRSSNKLPNETLGKLVLGFESLVRDQIHWNNMIKAPGAASAQWHALDK